MPYWEIEYKTPEITLGYADGTSETVPLVGHDLVEADTEEEARGKIEAKFAHFVEDVRPVVTEITPAPQFLEDMMAEAKRRDANDVRS